MKLASVCLALLALITGLIAAGCWRKASKVLFVPIFQTSSGFAFVGTEETRLWVRAIVESLQKAGHLNKIAAQWTAVAVTLGAAASVMGAFAS